MNMGVPIFNNLGMELSEEKERGLVNAILMISWTGSWMVSTAVGGAMIEAYGYTTTINFTIVLYLISTGVFFYLFKNVEKQTDGAKKYVLVR